MNPTTLDKPKYRYRIYPDCYEAEGPFGSSRVFWKHLHSIQETKSFIGFYPAPNMLHPIPKRIFKEMPQEYQVLRDLLSGLPDIDSKGKRTCL